MIVKTEHIEVLKQSEISELIYYYNDNTGKMIAEAIQKVNLSQNDVARDKLVDLYEDFVHSLKSMLEEV